MRGETWLARLVFAAGALVLIATSPPPYRWSDHQDVETEFESQGDGDDKLVRVHVQLTEGVARRSDVLHVTLVGKVDRPASDLTIAWRDDKPDAAAPDGLPRAFGTSDDFVSVYDNMFFSPECADEKACELVFTAVIATESSEAYAMQLEVALSIRGYEKKRPPGLFQARVEVIDAP